MPATAVNDKTQKVKEKAASHIEDVSELFLSAFPGCEQTDDR